MSRRPRKLTRDPNAPLRVVTYRRVSTDEQGNDGHGLDAQLRVLTDAAEQRSWDVVADLVDAGVSGGKAFGRRSAGSEALTLLTSGQADVLAVSKADRLSRSLLDLLRLVEQSQREGWSLVLLDMGLDMTTPAGQFTFQVMGAAAEYERGLAGQRTREGLAAARAKGVRLGRPSSLPADVVSRIVSERGQGLTMSRIAEQLTAEGVPTAHGGAKWHPSTVRAVLLSQAAQQAGTAA
jgi:DNA invertase Pin-like site-specific DNA recombinase